MSNTKKHGYRPKYAEANNADRKLNHWWLLLFLWLASPVASHLIARLEVITNEHLAEYCELPADKWEDELC
jgi:multisubunit Na+/H+ antiporter MnhG subunit